MYDSHNQTSSRSSGQDCEPWAEYLTPEQRLTIVADILSTIAVRIIKKRHEQPEQSPAA
jgi:hypothetical protein